MRDRVIRMSIGNKAMFYREALRFIRFIIVGVINTAAGFGFYCAYIYINFPYPVAGFLSLVSGVLFNYLVTRKFVFERNTRKHTFFYYIVTYGILYLFSLALAWFLIDVLHYSAYMAGFISLPINASVSFILLKTIVFPERNEA